MLSLPRSIVHLDADAFFASVEQSADARLRGKPVAVGGEKRGIVASASYEARKFGIYTPMPTVQARRLCPKLIIVPGDFEKYELFSRLMFSYAYDFTPDVEIGSIDEGYFDLSGAPKPAWEIAQTIRRAIRQSLKLSVSEGIASNKLVSQIASKFKKPSAFHFVPAGHEAGFLSPLVNKWLPGIGPKTANQLNAAGLARIGQVARTPPDLLSLLVGSLGPQLRNFARGLDERPVIPVRAPAKSYGEQETFAADTTDEPFLEATLRRMADKLMAKVRADKKSVRTLTVKVRYNDMAEDQAAQSLKEPTDLETEIYDLLSMLLRKAWKRRVSLRLVSLKLSNLYDGRFRSGLALDIPAQRHDAQQRLSDIVDELRQKYGRGVLLRGHDFILRRKQNRGEEPLSECGVRSVECGIQSGGRPPGPSPGGEGRGEGEPQPKCGMRNAECGMVADRQVQIKNSSIRPAPPYLPLNLHSYYSFLDSTLSIRAIIELAQHYELPAIALTDTHNLHGAVEFAQAAALAGIKPIIGTELRWQGQTVCLYVENQKGYHHLCRILNQSSAEPIQCGVRNAECGIQSGGRPPGPSPGGEGRGEGEPQPKCALRTGLAETEGLLAVSSCAELAQYFPNRFYLAIDDPQAFDPRSTPLPCVPFAPIHYAHPSDRWKYNIVQSIRTLTLLRQQHPQKRLAGDYHFRSPGETQQLFASYPKALDYTRELAERCSFAYTFGKPQFPSYSPPDGSTPAAFLRRLVMDGLQRRYPKDHLRLKPQLEEELFIITEVGYEEYFLVMWDLLQECRQRGIEWITRGSAADSLACYCLEISGVCPIRFDLYFRRFLNKDRMALNKLPDIDVDFPHDRKDDVIDMIFAKYGAKQTAIVGGFSTFQSRSAFAEVAKVLGASDFQVRRITERLPSFSRVNELGEAIAETQECRDLPLQEEPYRTALQMGCFLDSFPRYPKMHPCGLVLSRQPMDELVPCFISAKGYPTTHFDMDSVEAAGLVKMDILAQGGLAVMRDVRQGLSEWGVENGECGIPHSEWGTPSPPPSPPGEGAGIPHSDASWIDPEVWELISSGQARAVHHIESPAMISLCKMCNARDIDTLIAIVSVIRPGAANESKKMEFARRYQGLSPVRYPHPSLEACLRSTYGLVVYEEHILQICEAFAGLPPGRADILRRALAKEKPEIIAQIQPEFTACARQRGRTEAEITEVWNLVTGFKGYAFCKAHSTAYGVEAYQSAWLKRYYPVEFMAAVLTNGKGFYQPLVYVLECHRLGIPLLPPSVNQPGPHFTVTQGKIRVPVLQIKGLTQRTKEGIVTERARRQFTSLADFLGRVRPLNEEMEALIRAGAFDEFGKSRTAQFWEFKSGHGLASEAGRAPEQLWLFPAANLERLPSVPLVEPDRFQRLRWEEELLGYPASGHPLELFPEIAWETYCPINRLSEHLGEQVITCGLVIEQRLFHQVTGEPMKFLTICDWTGMIETELFARTYKSYGLNTVRYRVLEITATVEPFENGRGHSLRVLRAGKPREKQRC